MILMKFEEEVADQMLNQVMHRSLWFGFKIFAEVNRNPQNTPKMAIFDLVNFFKATKTFGDLIGTYKRNRRKAYTSARCRKGRIKDALKGLSLKDFC